MALSMYEGALKPSHLGSKIQSGSSKGSRTDASDIGGANGSIDGDPIV
jgi:hypothetical protein